MWLAWPGNVVRDFRLLFFKFLDKTYSSRKRLAFYDAFIIYKKKEEKRRREFNTKGCYR